MQDRTKDKSLVLVAYLVLFALSAALFAGTHVASASEPGTAVSENSAAVETSDAAAVSADAAVADSAEADAAVPTEPDAQPAADPGQTAEDATVYFDVYAYFIPLSGGFSRIPNEVVSVRNVDTGAEYTVNTGTSGIGTIGVPAGTYEFTLVSFPEDSDVLQGKHYTLPSSMTRTIAEGQRLSVPMEIREVATKNVSLNTQFADAKGNYTRIPGAVSKAVNTETGEEYTFAMGADGTIPHLNLPIGTYELSVVSLPTDSDLLAGRHYTIPEPFTKEVTETDLAYGWTITVRETTRDVSLNTQFMSLDRVFTRIPGAISKAVNLETGDEFTFTMGADGTVPHLDLPLGTYEISVVSLPTDGMLLAGKKLTMPESFTEEVNENGRAYGWTITVNEATSDPDNSSGFDNSNGNDNGNNSNGKDDSNGKDNGSSNGSDNGNGAAGQQKPASKNASNLPVTGDDTVGTGVAASLFAVGVALLAIGGRAWRKARGDARR